MANNSEFWQNWKEFKANCINMTEDEVNNRLNEFLTSLENIYSNEELKLKQAKKMKEEVSKVYRTGTLYVKGWYINSNGDIKIRPELEPSNMPRLLWDVANFIFNSDKIMAKYMSDANYAANYDEYIVQSVSFAFQRTKDEVRNMFGAVVERFVMQQLQSSGVIIEEPKSAPDITPEERQKILDYLSERTIASSFYVFVQLNPSIHQLGIDLKKIEFVYSEERDKYIAKMTEQQKMAADTFENNYNFYIE